MSVMLDIKEPNQGAAVTAVDEVRQAFEDRVSGVLQLLQFDDLVLEHLVGGLAGLAEELDRHNLHSLSVKVGNRLQLLKNIRDAQSLRPSYQTIYNQCVVLLVSYFDASMGDLFRATAAYALIANRNLPICERTVDLSWRNLSRPDVPVALLIADRIVEQDKIKFQDMQSIRRAFERNLGVDFGRDETANDIILGQAARHVMVHAAGKIDVRFLEQVAGAQPRRLKPSVTAYGVIQFEPDEVRLLAESMLRFFSTGTRLLTQVPSQPSA